MQCWWKAAITCTQGAVPFSHPFPLTPNALTGEGQEAILLGLSENKKYECIAQARERTSVRRTRAHATWAFRAFVISGGRPPGMAISFATPAPLRVEKIKNGIGSRRLKGAPAPCSRGHGPGRSFRKICHYLIRCALT
jgi:hypothetical protein